MEKEEAQTWGTVGETGEAGGWFSTEAGSYRTRFTDFNLC